MEVEAHKHNKRPRQKHIEQIIQRNRSNRFGLGFLGMNIRAHT